MNRVFFRSELECVATFWRVRRKDGVAIGLTSHDRDLWLDGIMHRASPGMVPAAIRREAGLQSDSAEVSGALSHDSISQLDLEAGRFDGSHVEIGLVDWESGESAVLYSGELGEILQEAAGFSAQLLSAKAKFEADFVPRTSPGCRAEFCGTGCTLNSMRFTHEAKIKAVDRKRNGISLDPALSAETLIGGHLRWVDGSKAGQKVQIVDGDGEWIILRETVGDYEANARVILREGCDHTFASCRDRFANSLNFQGEPFLPGNDLLTRYPSS